jgi:hypothetical protein
MWQAGAVVTRCPLHVRLVPSEPRLAKHSWERTRFVNELRVVACASRQSREMLGTSLREVRLHSPAPALAGGAKEMVCLNAPFDFR